MLKSFFESVTGFDSELKTPKRLASLESMRTVLAYDLIDEETAKRLGKYLRSIVFLKTNTFSNVVISYWRIDFEFFVQLVGEVGEKFEGVLLLAYVDRISPQLENGPKLLRNEVLQLAIEKMTENLLHLIKRAREEKKSITKYLIQWIPLGRYLSSPISGSSNDKRV